MTGRCASAMSCTSPGRSASGPTGIPPEGAYAQAVASLRRIQAALEALDASLADVVRTRMYVVDVERHQFDVGRAHGEFFADVRPVSTMIGIAGLVGPEFLVEIEVEAIVASRPGIAALLHLPPVPAAFV